MAQRGPFGASVQSVTYSRCDGKTLGCVSMPGMTLSLSVAERTAGNIGPSVKPKIRALAVATFSQSGLAPPRFITEECSTVGRIVVKWKEVEL